MYVSICYEDLLGLFVYQHMVGAERLGAALDVLLEAFDTESADMLTPSLLRRNLLELTGSTLIKKVQTLYAYMSANEML